MKERDYIQFRLNGELVQERGPSCFLMLSTYLRQERHLTGTKVVCAEGDCAACTVLVVEAEGQELRPINACITPLYLMDGHSLLTVEALGAPDTLSAVQQAMVDENGSQCGFCTPGFVMAMTGLLHQKSALTTQEIRNGLTGNLCRCTGYRPIVEAAKAVDLSTLTVPIVPPPPPPLGLSVRIGGPNDAHLYAAPTSWSEVCRIQDEWAAEQRTVTLCGAATDLGVQINKGKLTPTTVLDLKLIPETQTLMIIRHPQLGEVIQVGAKVSLARLRRFVADKIPELARFLNLFASPQIKNMATLAGNIANGSPIGDSWPFLLVTHSHVEVMNRREERRTIPLTELLVGYKKFTWIQGEEWITNIFLTIPPKSHILKLYKVSKRKDLDISSVNAAFCAEIKALTIREIKIAYGGVGPRCLRAPQTEAFLQGKRVSFALFEAAAAILEREFTPLSDFRASSDYRKLLVRNLLYKFYYEISH